MFPNIAQMLAELLSQATPYARAKCLALLDIWLWHMTHKCGRRPQIFRFWSTMAGLVRPAETLPAPTGPEARRRSATQSSSQFTQLTDRGRLLEHLTLIDCSLRRSELEPGRGCRAPPPLPARSALQQDGAHAAESIHAEPAPTSLRCRYRRAAPPSPLRQRASCCCRHALSRSRGRLARPGWRLAAAPAVTRGLGNFPCWYSEVHRLRDQNRSAPGLRPPRKG
jgi:hypothetical protein